MKNPFRAQAPPMDVRAITETIERALSAAGLRNAPRGAFIDVQARVVPGDSAAGTAGVSQRHSFSNAAGTRAYQLHVPARLSDPAPPLLVMLHGCTQSADDFALGTQMNRLADEQGFLVLYPEQAAQANPSKCWNWFSPGDQSRQAGEPSLIAGMVREVAAQHGVDPRRIFVAGLSAGGAMAVIMGETHPELFAGVGVHSGLPYASAHDVGSAMAAMKGGRGQHSMAPAGQAAGQPVPTIVFHGDRDHTVQQSNATAIVEQARQAYLRSAGATALSTSTHSEQAPGGRRYTRTVHSTASGQAHIESWALHGAGHAWSGGDARGSYTDPKGPDASAQMLRFFLALAPKAGGSR